MTGGPPPDRPPTAFTALWRGLTRRCPWCGEGRLFTQWFRMAEACPQCGLPLGQEEGAFLGAMALNYGVAGTLFLAILIAWTAMTAPDIPVVPMLVVSLGVTAASIVLFYPFSKTLWAAVDLLLHRMDRRDRERFEDDLRRPPPTH
ncbi:MAG TPA: DUF983 domain-containing protein [Actinomycetota bacterium]|nr:DUF983 domain-containing protein [Actinomycetota bacterium]